MSNEPVHLVTTKPDAEIAKELKEEAMEAVKPILTISDKAAANGFILQFGIGMGPFGKTIVQNLDLIKKF